MLISSIRRVKGHRNSSILVAMKHGYLLFLTLCLFGCSSPDGSQPSVNGVPEPGVFPDDTWARATPASQNVDPEVLDATLAFLASHCKSDGLQETMVIRNGYLIWSGDSIDKVHDIWSCTKSFTSTAAGLMASEGILDLDQKVSTHEPRLQALYPDATYRHFLTMTSGYNAEGATRWPTDVSEDWSLTPYQPTTPLFPPGTEFTYWDEAMIILGRALTQAAGVSLNDYLEERLFAPIGITKRDWWGEGEVPEGVPINFGGTGLRMSASEQARFGLLMLNEGNWKGRQLVPADFVSQATTNQVTDAVKLADTDRKGTDGVGRYGFNWWIINQGTDAPVAGAFTSGLNHNVCLIVPEWNLVLVRMGIDGNPEKPKWEVYAEVLKQLAPGIE